MIIFTQSKKKERFKNFCILAKPFVLRLACRIIFSQKLVQSVSVYNLAGQQISTQKLNVTNGKVSTSALTSGVYVFRAVLEGRQVETFKIIKK